jgi:hypothetical protein
MVARFALLVIVVAALACDDGSSVHEDPGVADAGPLVSLGGTTPCGGGTCARGRLCNHEPFSANVDQYYCVDVPSGCRVRECDVGHCAACVAALCPGGCAPRDGCGAVTSRNLLCPFVQ